MKNKNFYDKIRLKLKEKTILTDPFIDVIFKTLTFKELRHYLKVMYNIEI